MVQMAKVQDRAWRISNAEPVRRLDRSVGLLLALESAVLPALHTFPDMSSLVDALRLYINNLSDHAGATGGQFSIRAEDLCNRLSEYVRRADAKEEVAELRTGVAPLMQAVTDLLNTEVTISQARNVQ
ncbi:hypothetical protein CFC21_109627 [Triticum aestivum]|uniref:Uncharacterized protein n=3 Tax=Triticinae TaxID=1648030 RepID=A0A453S311_AEGTS|nr:hypothetical protein CFC21_109627 [Triticum aestivum]